KSGSSSAPGGAVAHAPLVCGLDEPGEVPICPGCLAGPPPPPILEQMIDRLEAEERWRRDSPEVERLKCLLRDHGEAFLPVLLDLLAPALAAAVREMLAAELPEALDYLTGGGRGWHADRKPCWSICNKGPVTASLRRGT